MYLGSEFSNEEIKKVLDNKGIKYTEPENYTKVVGELLADGKIIGRYNGRQEFGPRALGNRSILGAPFDADINNWLNDKLNRTEFMPFAPSIIEEKASDYLEGYNKDHIAANFMTITYNIKKGKSEEIPAVVHVDNTARPQVVKKDINPSFYAIIEAFYKKTGCAAVLNTSFNMHEEPIVRTPEHAVKAFFQSQLDYLSIGKYLVSLEDNKEFIEQ
ncbi:MAG: carbamoyltransferase C-terminal domain-containing protein [Flavobacteriales bacterium]